MSATYFIKHFVKNHIKKNHNLIDAESLLSSILSDLLKINYYRHDINSSNIKYARKKYLKKIFVFFLKKIK